MSEGLISSGPKLRTLPTARSTLNHSKTSVDSPSTSTICSARSFGVAGSNHSLASSGDNVIGRRSWMSTIPPALSAVMITKPSCSPGPCSAFGYRPMAAQKMGDRSCRRMRYRGSFGPPSSTYSNQLLIAMIDRCGQMVRKNGPWATFSTLAFVGATLLAQCGRQPQWIISACR